MKNQMNYGLLFIRFSIGFPMLVYGISKLRHGIDFIYTLLSNLGLPEFLAYGVYVGEVIAPILLIVGYRTKIAAIAFATNCLTAFLLVQTHQLFRLNTSGGWAAELLFIYFTVSLALVFTGGGKLGISNENKWD